MNPAVYGRPAGKPKRLVGKTRRREAAPVAEPLPEVVELSKATECFVTSPEWSRKLVAYCLGDCGDKLTLEPHAGTGNLIRALFDAGQSPYELVAIERSFELCAALRKRFTGREYVEPMQRCFLEYAQAAAGGIEYPQIVMNPPFRHVRKHIEAGLSLLGRGGHEFAVMAAVVPVTFEHAEAEFVCALPVDAFTGIKINTKIIKFLR